MTKEIGYEKYYESIYGGLSFESHGLNATMGLSVGKDGLLLKEIRNPEGVGTTFDLACVFLLGGA